MAVLKRWFTPLLCQFGPAGLDSSRPGHLNSLRVHHWMRNYKSWWYLILLGPWSSTCQCLYYLQKTMWRGQGKSHESLWVSASGLIGEYWPHKFWRPRSSVFSGSTPRNKKQCGSTHTTTVSAYMDIEKKRKDRKRKLFTEKSIVTRNITSEKALGTKATRINVGALQLGGSFSRRINNDKPHCTKPVTGSGLTCQLCRWARRKKLLHMCKFSYCARWICLLNTSRFFTRAEHLLNTGKWLHHWRKVGQAGDKW